MAAIYSGIHLKLKSPRTPWGDKLKLARFAWISPQCFLPNKEQVLFDWTSHALTGYYSKKVELPPDVLEGLWSYLDDILHSKKLRNVLSQGKSLSLRLAVAQVINERILECVSGLCVVSVSTVLSCCHGILSSPVLSITYTAKYELLVELLGRLCALACSRLGSQPSVEPLRPQIFEVLLLAISSYLVVQRQQGNPNRVFAQVTAHLLQPLLLLRHMLAVRVWAAEDDASVRQNLSKEIRNKVDAVLQSALFLPDHLSSYKEELLQEKEASGPNKGTAGKGLLSPVNTILNKLCDPGFCDPALHFGVRSNSLPFIFKFSLDAFCKGGENKLIGFQLLKRFVAALDFTDEITVKSTFDVGNWSQALLALENLLNFSLIGDIYNVAADRIQHGEIQFNFYRKVAQLLFNNVQSNIPAWYRCLKALLTLNHLIIEPDLDELVSSAWIDADCMDPRVKKAREALVTVVFQSYEKLRQLPRLMEEVLAVICRPAADKLRPPVLSSVMHQSFSRCLLDSPHSQSLEVCSLILESVQNYILPDLEEQEDVALKLFSLTVLLHSVLFSVKSLDNSTPVPIIRRAQSLMENITKVVKSLVLLLHHQDCESPWFEKILEATLLLSYSWVEVDTLFKIHCVRYISPADPESSSLAEESLCCLPCVAVKEWGEVVSVFHQCGPTSRYLQELLALQRMKQILLMTDFWSDGSIRDVLCKVVQFIVRTGRTSVSQPSNELWDCQVSSVDVKSYPVAHWLLVTSNLALIAPYLAGEDMLHIAEVLVSTVLQKDVQDQTSQGVSLSVSLISRQLLDSIVLVELSPMYSAVVRCFTQRIVGILCKSKEGVQCRALQNFAEVVFDGAEDNMEVSARNKYIKTNEISCAWKKLEIIAHEVLNPGAAGVAITLSKTQTESLLHLLQASRPLKPDGMSPEDHSEYFLLLFFLATSVQCECDTEPEVAIELLKEVYHLMASLQSGKNLGSVLKVVHGNELLEAAVTSLFSHSKKNISKSVDSAAWPAFLQMVQDFLHCLIQMIIHRRSSVRLNMEKFSSFMVDGEAAARVLYATPGKLGVADLIPLQLWLATLSTLCKAMVSSMGKSKLLDETLTQLLEKATASMGPAIQTCLKSQTCSLLGQSVAVEVVTVMIQAESAQASCLAPKEEGGSTHCGLRNMGLYRSFAQQILRELCSSPRPKNFVFSSLHFLAAYCTTTGRIKSPGEEDLFVLVLQNLRKLLSAPWLSVTDVRELEAPARELLVHLVEWCTPEQFHHLLVVLGEGLGGSWVSSGGHTEILSAVMLVKLLASCPLPETHAKAFWLTAPQIISAIVFVVKESGKESSLTAPLTVPSVEALTSLLRQGEGWLLNPHHVTLALGALHFIPLEHLSTGDYYAAFLAVHEALFAIIQCHPQVMLKAAPSFLNCFYRLVASIMHEGRQRGASERGTEDSEVLLRCARLVERMYTHIASAAEGFTVLSSFIVAQYVSELQKVTLQPDIKRHLTEGVYKILDLCVEQDVKFLSTTLPMGVREVFSELYNCYTHYHKTQRHGEEKYSAKASM